MQKIKENIDEQINKFDKYVITDVEVTENNISKTRDQFKENNIGTR